MPARDRLLPRDGPGATPTIGSATATGGACATAGDEALAIAMPATASTTPAAPDMPMCSPSTMTASTVVIPP